MIRNVTSHTSAQNKGWQLVGHLVKVRTLSQSIIAFPIGNVQ